MILRGAKTLAIRMERVNTTSLAVAKFLESHPKVDKVSHPGLKSHPQHKLAQKQMRVKKNPIFQKKFFSSKFKKIHFFQKILQQNFLSFFKGK